jgi:hypothetical protein
MAAGMIAIDHQVKALFSVASACAPARRNQDRISNAEGRMIDAALAARRK